MVTSLSWIKEYVPGLDKDPQEYMDAMTLSGSKGEGFTVLNEDLDKIVIGQIREIAPHPDADKLVICQVDIGTETIQIVTGAPNAVQGAKVPVVLDGGRVAGGHDGSRTPGGIRIKKGKLRGVESDGMMCSIEELGSSRDFYPDAPENGLYIFPEDAPVGEDAAAYLGLDDAVIEYEITSNRVDCFSVMGIAREAAATFQLPYRAPEIKETGNAEDVNSYIRVSVQDTDLCSRYTARVVKNIHLAPSPAWMQHRLAAHGIRPINNIVDITNYVMEEMGQPMHAYDLDTIAGHEIQVRRATAGETFVTLDGQERKLDDSMLMICDSEKPIGLAGIMGGENSMITDQVKTMLFEAACFDGTNIRLSSRKAGLRTDASAKFEKGLDPNLAMEAMNRACYLIELLGAGEVVGGAVDVYPVKKEGHRIPFEPDWINSLLGTDLTGEEMLEYLTRVYLTYDPETNEILCPSWRQDLLRDADIAEEVARFYGYDRIPETLPSGEATAGGLSFKLRVEAKVREVSEFCGFSQGMCYSFESPKVFDRLLLPAEDPLRQAIVISNPLGEDYSIMRTSSVNGMMTSLATNYNRRNKTCRLYEMGNIYIPKVLPLTELPDERMQLTYGMYGDGDFFDLKGVLEELFDQLGLKERREYRAEGRRPYLHPGRQAEVYYDGQPIAWLGEVHPTVIAAYGMKGRALLAVVDLPSLMLYVNFDKKYTGIARYPAVTRDLSLMVPKAVTAGEIENLFLQRGGRKLEEIELFDIYEGEQVKEGYKSLAYKLTFRAADRTLTEEDIQSLMTKIMDGLHSLGIDLRQ